MTFLGMLLGTNKFQILLKLVMWCQPIFNKNIKFDSYLSTVQQLFLFLSIGANHCSLVMTNVFMGNECVMQRRLFTEVRLCGMRKSARCSSRLKLWVCARQPKANYDSKKKPQIFMFCFGILVYKYYRWIFSIKPEYGEHILFPS